MGSWQSAKSSLVEIPGATLASEFDELGTYETKECVNGGIWIREHAGRREAEEYYSRMVRVYRLRAEWFATFD